ncbi:leucyl aminopeptidase family protein [Pseudooceanicola sediminis]|uniref:Leucyl aminopeptidase family protein n=1 Tax=Pseudooceanicola sediminis TaxID=2211117 RepID=A0A399IX12_9RHOB|nr:leucyl aminopeptidase family protein [Pseudooceanicola sediminis]KAA2312511.1 leucyl aminopeptidase family protein [Puniceibacterium sp. HSS470]RII37520.1 leucyl aminopeptidase family protein [Pseudooceanicola sediminis]|tara:strand:- start:72918 stop:74345 length:1428 start_codon:yes stop_codon:yes gene_type:complete
MPETTAPNIAPHTALTFAPDSSDALPLHVVESDALAAFLKDQPDAVATWVAATGFTGGLRQACVVPGSDGAPIMALVGYGDAAARARGRFWLAAAAEKLPKGSYRIASGLPEDMAEVEALGWLFAGYRFDRYKTQSPLAARLVAPEGLPADRLEAIATGEALTRDLINTPASDMGPADLEQAARALADRFGADTSVITGDDLLAQNFPMIHAVGRAAAPHRAPRLIDLRWGTNGPTLTLVGKGVCFDTGGLNIKPGASMGLMKKDMGGAATVLGLAQMIMARDLPVRLRVLIPAVENAIAGDAFRPQDILTARNGLTVEINNTDAEGRLVLADALALGAEETPDLMISMATLTGAARVAVGPDLAPFFTDDSEIATALQNTGGVVADPVWRLPFWEPYETMIEPGIADLDNAPKGGFAGSITAALFLRRFAGTASRYTHFDIYGWNPTAAPARAKGGTGQGARALFSALPLLLGL